MDIWNLRGKKLRFLDEAQEERLHEASLELLWTTGCLFQDASALNVFSDAGAVVDRAKQLVRIPPRLVEEALNNAPKRVLLAARDPRYDILLEGVRVYFGTSSVPINVLDLDTGELRQGTKQDCMDFPRLVDALEYIHFYKATIFPCDVPPMIADRWMLYGGFANTTKQVLSTCFSVNAALDNLQMAEVLAGGSAELSRRPLMVTNVLCTAPLQWCTTNTRILVELAKRKVPLIIGSEPQAGTTAPITLLGATLLQNAETLAGITLAQIIQPGLPVLMGAVGSISDMRTLNFASGAVELGMMNSVAAQMSQRYGIPLYATGGMSDAKTTDVQAGYEKGIQLMLTALSGGNYIHDAAGMLEHCLTLSYEQYVIDNEICGMVARALNGIRHGEDALALNLIREIGPTGNFLNHPHTLDYYKEEQFIPELSDRQPRDIWKARGGKTALDKARARAKEILFTHQPEALPDDVDHELRDIIRAAETKLGTAT